MGLVITGAHAILYSTDADADRAFLHELLGTTTVDAGGGWLILALPPAEVAVHPTDGPPQHELYLLCDDDAPRDAESSSPAASSWRAGSATGAGAASSPCGCQAAPRWACTSRATPWRPGRSPAQIPSANAAVASVWSPAITPSR